MSWQDPAPENSATTFSHWLRRLWPAYCLLAALATFGYALYDPYQIDGDAVSYMDIGDLIRAHNWHAVVNGYWNPLYPSLLSLGHIFFRASRFTELHAYYMVNFGIFLLEIIAAVFFTDALLQFRGLREEASPSARSCPFLLGRYPLRYIAIALLLVSTQRELSMGKVRPDTLLQVCLLFAIGALLKLLATNHQRYAALMGLALGLAYLTKSFAFLFTFVCIGALIAFRIFWQRHVSARVAIEALITFICFTVIAGPYIAALSSQKGRFDFGDSGNLNYAWFVSGTERGHLQPDQPSSFGVAEVRLIHPEKLLMQQPLILSYQQLPYGTYPHWFDPSFWNDHVKARINLRRQISAIAHSLLRFVRYLTDHPEGWILLILLFLLGARLNPGRALFTHVFWLVPFSLGAAVICIYALISIEDRYITIGLLLILLSLFAALRRPESSQASGIGTAASACVLLLSLFVLGESAHTVGELRRQLKHIHSPGGWYNPEIYRAAQALNALGVNPGDTVACIGDRACLLDQYWARLAGVRILTEIYEPTVNFYPALVGMPNRQQALDVVRRQGVTVLVGSFNPTSLTPTSITSNSATGTSLLSEGWLELDGTAFYALPLNLPANAAEADHP